MGLFGGKPKVDRTAQFFQQGQTVKAKQQEQDRQTRLALGMDAINALFDGGTYDTQQDVAFDWKKLPAFGVRNDKLNAQALGLPQGFKLEYRADHSVPNGGYGVQVVGPDGRMWSRGEQIKTTVKDAKSAPGFQPGFFDNYKQAYLDYYMPELSRQYTDARDDLTYNLARAGTLQSSVATDKMAKLLYEKNLNDATLRSQADSATGDLRNRVQQEKASAINQLYATEDPGAASNIATTAVRNINLSKPQLDPLGALFAPALTAAGTGFQAYNNARAFNSIPQARNPGASSGKARP